jgi:hypothetical protein
VHEATPQNGAQGPYYSGVKKVVKAYKDGGRGSFVGKRFEYGKNVRGITKTQEVTQNKEDSVIYIDNVGVDVYYDIDFALKSAEIPEIEIGDTHYVIDNDFHPPMTIKARIGKIEVSFSDPTKNKLTVANTKKIMGAVVDDDDINDTIKNIDDTISDTITDDYIYDIVDDTITDDYIRTIVEEIIADGNGGDCELSKYIEIVDNTHSWDTPGMGAELHVRRKTFFDGPIILTGAWADEMGVASIYYRSISGVSTIEAETVKCDILEFSDGTTMTTAGGSSSSGGSELVPNVLEVINGKLHIKAPVDFNYSTNFSACGIGVGGGADLTGVVKLEAMTIYASTIHFDDGTFMNTASGGGTGNNSSSFNTITVSGTSYLNNDVRISGDLSIYGHIYTARYFYPDDATKMTKIYGSTSFINDLWVGGKIYGTLANGSDRSLKENIRYLDDTVMATSDDLLDKADLHDFIVNQVDLCEFNYIGDTSNKIGFIANDYEGTKVGDKIVFRSTNEDGAELLSYDVNNLLFATIGALQEEVRMRDEQIASLEARLAKIEEMLNNK